MDTAVPQPTGQGQVPELEECVCPQGYTGLSCEVRTRINSCNVTMSRQLMHSGEDGGCRVGEVRAGTTSPMPDHKGFKLQ